jgi:hypothetical protein
MVRCASVVSCSGSHIGMGIMQRMHLTLAAAGSKNVEADAISKQPGFSIAWLPHCGHSMTDNMHRQVVR